MSLASKIGWAGIAFALLTTGMLAQGFSQSAAGSDSNQEEVAAFVIKNEITKMQEILRDKGHYRGKVDGVFGLRARASIRAYQKAENLPVTGQVDRRTADGLGLRPESNWNNSQYAARQNGHGSDRAGGEIKREKPSAGIKWAKGLG
jgi:peptidoglycan hydrolase-like protein with peptidoglycan-binding domain